MKVEQSKKQNNNNNKIVEKLTSLNTGEALVYSLSSRFWVNQPKVQGLAEGKLTVLSGIHPRNTLAA